MLVKDNNHIKLNSWYSTKIKGKLIPVKLVEIGKNGEYIVKPINKEENIKVRELHYVTTIGF